MIRKYHDPFVGGIASIHCAQVFRQAPNVRFIFCGGRDGTISMWQVENDEEVTDSSIFKECTSASFKSSPIAFVGLSSKDDRTIDEPARVHYGSVEDSGGVEPQDEPVYLDRIEVTQALDEPDGSFNGSSIIRNRLNDMREKLQELLQSNEVAPDLEKLDRMEFVIDAEARDAYIQAGEEAVRETR